MIQKDWRKKNQYWDTRRLQGKLSASYFYELLFYIFEFLSEVLQVRLKTLHLHDSPLLQRLITLSHQLKTLGHFVGTLLHTQKKKLVEIICNKIINNRIENNFYRQNHQTIFTLKISLPASLSSLIWASAVSREIHCSLYISARRWACFISSFIAWCDGYEYFRYCIYYQYFMMSRISWWLEYTDYLQLHLLCLLWLWLWLREQRSCAAARLPRSPRSRTSWLGLPQTFVAWVQLP